MPPVFKLTDNFAVIFRQKRLERGLTTGQLERLSGVLRSDISLYENGRRVPNARNFIRICAVLNLEIKDFLEY